MANSGSSAKQDQVSLKALERRAKAILKARPAYKEMVDFYLTVFRRQIEWRDKLTVHPEAVNDEQRKQCVKKGQPLLDCFDPGLDADSLLALWGEMKSIFRKGNDVLCKQVDKIEEAEKAGDFTPATWLMEQRPDRPELIADVCEKLNVDDSMLSSLARAVTLPHWELVSQSWLTESAATEWKRFQCPTCGGDPGLVEIRTDPSTAEGLMGAPRRFMHCLFCGSRWLVPGLKCPSCGSTKDGDAKYYFTSDEPDLRIDFCNGCRHYVKVIDGDKVSGHIHAGLELLAAAHLDMLAQEKDLSPLEVCA